MPELVSDFVNVVNKDVAELIHEQRQKEAVNNLASQDPDKIATFAPGAGSMSANGPGISY